MGSLPSSVRCAGIFAGCWRCFCSGYLKRHREFSLRVSGVRVLSFSRFTHRARFILAAAPLFSVADLLVPDFFIHLFDGVSNPSNTLRGFFNVINAPVALLRTVQYIGANSHPRSCPVSSRRY